MAILQQVCLDHFQVLRPLSLHLGDLSRRNAQEIDAWNIVMGRLWCCLQHASNQPLTQFHVGFFQNHKETQAGDSIFGLSLSLSLATQTGPALSDLTYNNRFTSSREPLFNLFNPRAKKKISSQRVGRHLPVQQQLMMSTGPCSYQIPPALSIIPCEITAIGYYCTNYGHVSRRRRA